MVVSDIRPGADPVFSFAGGGGGEVNIINIINAKPDAPCDRGQGPWKLSGGGGGYAHNCNVIHAIHSHHYSMKIVFLYCAHFQLFPFTRQIERQHDFR